MHSLSHWLWVIRLQAQRNRVKMLLKVLVEVRLRLGGHLATYHLPRIVDLIIVLIVLLSLQSWWCMPTSGLASIRRVLLTSLCRALLVLPLLHEHSLKLRIVDLSWILHMQLLLLLHVRRWIKDYLLTLRHHVLASLVLWESRWRLLGYVRIITRTLDRLLGKVKALGDPQILLHWMHFLGCSFKTIELGTLRRVTHHSRCLQLLLSHRLLVITQLTLIHDLLLLHHGHLLSLVLLLHKILLVLLLLKLLLLLLHHHVPLRMLAKLNFLLFIDKLQKLLSGHWEYLVKPAEHKASEVFFRDAQNGRAVRLHMSSGVSIENKVSLSLSLELGIPLSSRLWYLGLNRLLLLKILRHLGCLRVENSWRAGTRLVLFGIFRGCWPLTHRFFSHCVLGRVLILFPPWLKGATINLSGDEGVLHCHRRAPPQVLINS